MKTKSFRYMWIGQALANLGDIFYIVGLISILYAVSESVLSLTLLPFVNTAGRFISGIFSPILFNKYRLKQLLVCSQWSKTIVLLGLIFWISLQDDVSVIGMVLFIFVIAFLDGWAMPASRAMLPRIVSDKEIVKANSFVAMVNQTIQLGGWAIGGALVALLDGQQVIWLTFVLFLFSSVMMCFIIDPTPSKHTERNRKVLEVLMEGWKIIWHNKLFRTLHVVLVIESMANVVWIAAIIYVFVSEVLHKSEAWWGYINTTFFVGLLIGGVFCSRYSLFMKKQIKKIMLLSSIGVSFITFLFGINSVGWVALILSILFGLVEQIKSITFEAYIQREATSSELPKIYGTQEALLSICFGIFSLMIGSIAEWFGVKSVFILASLMLAGSALYLIFVQKRFTKSYF
ncbi:MFS transporter [Bacillus spongiae]|uniref:MFS transporter n=1 Tax=Bacillus spongiae TaxID=2683610 RepID=A0ABU8HCB0_9BACI